MNKEIEEIASYKYNDSKSLNSISSLQILTQNFHKQKLSKQNTKIVQKTDYFFFCLTLKFSINGLWSVAAKQLLTDFTNIIHNF